MRVKIEKKNTFKRSMQLCREGSTRQNFIFTRDNDAKHTLKFRGNHVKDLDYNNKVKI